MSRSAVVAGAPTPRRVGARPDDLRPQQRGDVVPEPTTGTRAVDQDYVGHGSEYGPSGYGTVSLGPNLIRKSPTNTDPVADPAAAVRPRAAIMLSAAAVLVVATNLRPGDHGRRARPGTHRQRYRLGRQWPWSPRSGAAAGVCRRVAAGPPADPAGRSRTGRVLCVAGLDLRHRPAIPARLGRQPVARHRHPGLGHRRLQRDHAGHREARLPAQRAGADRRVLGCPHGFRRTGVGSRPSDRRTHGLALGDRDLGGPQP